MSEEHLLRMEDLGWGQEDLRRKETMISAKELTGYLERLSVWP